MKSPLIALLVTLVSAFVFSACAPNLCQRKDKFMTSSMCRGTDITYAPDSRCERNLSVCPPAKLGAFEQYVRCLEGLKMCTMDTVNQCAAAYPSGVNLMCNG